MGRQSHQMHVFVLDNFDSFTYNLVQYLEILGAQTTIVRNNAIEVQDIMALVPDLILLSPGPGRPADAGVMPEVITQCAGHFPILGVCFGHQAGGEAFGATLTYAAKPLHAYRISLCMFSIPYLMAALSTSNRSVPFTSTRHSSAPS